LKNSYNLTPQNPSPIQIFSSPNEKGLLLWRIINPQSSPLSKSYISSIFSFLFFKTLSSLPLKTRKQSLRRGREGRVLEKRDEQVKNIGEIGRRGLWGFKSFFIFHNTKSPLFGELKNCIGGEFWIVWIFQIQSILL